MGLLANYEFRLRDGETIRGTTLYSTIERQPRQPEFPQSKIRCDLERVEVVHTTDDRFKPRIFWSDEVFGTNGNAQLLMEERDGDPLDIALVQVRQGQTWIVRSEPTMDDRIGITIANHKGKLLFTGIGDVIPVEYIPRRPNLPPKRGHVLTFGFNQVFRWRASSPMGSAHTSGSDRRESPAAYPDYSAPDGGTRVP